MKKWWVVVLFGLLIYGAGWAQLINAKTVVGEVASQKGNLLTLKENQREVILELTDETHVLIGSDLKTTADIRTGDKVSAIYREKGAQKIALSITITSKR